MAPIGVTLEMLRLTQILTAAVQVLRRRARRAERLEVILSTASPTCLPGVANPIEATPFSLSPYALPIRGAILRSAEGGSLTVNRMVAGSNPARGATRRY